MRAAESERLLGSMQEALDAGDVQIDDHATQLLAERHAAVMAWCVMIEARLLEVRSWFADAGGVEHRVIKGPAIAHLDEDDPAMRSFADLDLLIAAEGMDRAVAALAANDARRPWPERRPGFDRRFAKSVTMTCVDGIEVDLHRTLCDGVHGARIPLGELFETPDCFDVGGERIPTLSRPHRMLHAAYHAVLGSRTPRLLSLRDLARYLTSDDLRPDVIVPIARSWRGEAVLARAVIETTSRLTFEAPDWTRWVATLRVDPTEARLVDRQRSEGSSFGVSSIDLWRGIPGVRARGAYAFAVLWPTREHLRSRGLRRRDTLRQLVPGR